MARNKNIGTAQPCHTAFMYTCGWGEKAGGRRSGDRPGPLPSGAGRLRAGDRPGGPRGLRSRLHTGKPEKGSFPVSAASGGRGVPEELPAHGRDPGRRGDPTYGPTCRSLRHHHHGSLNTGLRAGGGPQKRVGVGAVASPAGLAGAESPQHAVELRIWGPKAAKASGAERPRGPVGDLQGKGASARVHPPPWWASGWPQDPLRLKPPCGGGVFSSGLWPALSSPGA